MEKVRRKFALMTGSIIPTDGLGQESLTSGLHIYLAIQPEMKIYNILNSVINELKPFLFNKHLRIDRLMSLHSH